MTGDAGHDTNLWSKTEIQELRQALKMTSAELGS